MTEGTSEMGVGSNDKADDAFLKENGMEYGRE